MPFSSHGPGSCPARAYIRALGVMRRQGPRPAMDKKNANELFDQGKTCNTMAATSMANAMRQRVVGKNSDLDVFGFALKWPPLYYMSCSGQKRSFAFFCPSLAVVLWISGLQKSGCEYCGTVVAALSCGRLAPSWHPPAADPNTKDQSRSSWPWPF